MVKKLFKAYGIGLALDGCENNLLNKYPIKWAWIILKNWGDFLGWATRV